MVSPRPRTEDEENESFLVQIDDELLTENTKHKRTTVLGRWYTKIHLTLTNLYLNFSCCCLHSANFTPFY